MGWLRERLGLTEDQANLESLSMQDPEPICTGEHTIHTVTLCAVCGVAFDEEPA